MCLVLLCLFYYPQERGYSTESTNDGFVFIGEEELMQNSFDLPFLLFDEAWLYKQTIFYIRKTTDLT